MYYLLLQDSTRLWLQLIRYVADTLEVYYENFSVSIILDHTNHSPPGGEVIPSNDSLLWRGVCVCVCVCDTQESLVTLCFS